MSQPTDDEAQDWRDLIACPGWARLKGYAADLFSAAALERHVELALDGADAAALGKLRQIVAAKRAVAQVLTHAEAEAKRSKPEETGMPHLGRRGAL